MGIILAAGASAIPGGRQAEEREELDGVAGLGGEPIQGEVRVGLLLLGHIQTSVPRPCDPNLDLALSLAVRQLYSRFRSPQGRLRWIQGQASSSTA